MGEYCTAPLLAWIVVQLVLVAVLQFVAPTMLLTMSSIFSPRIAFTVFASQFLWLLMGWVWVLAPSHCAGDAPYLYSGAFWLLLAYTVAVPMEAYWYHRIYTRAGDKPATTAAAADGGASERDGLVGGRADSAGSYA
eukprot:PLAT12559.1.p2 GENE.PLAT12559.1~~PLAT12559.1.p2  ORF type:complete len:137 (+),score=62.95 PLAT12559.1:148-558(+)